MSVVSALLESSEKLKGKFLDLKWQRKRRVKSNQSASRAWFGSSEHWVSGTTGLSEAAPSAFFTEVIALPPAGRHLVSLPFDLSQGDGIHMRLDIAIRRSPKMRRSNR